MKRLPKVPPGSLLYRVLREPSRSLLWTVLLALLFVLSCHRPQPPEPLPEAPPTPPAPPPELRTERPRTSPPARPRPRRPPTEPRSWDGPLLVRVGLDTDLQRIDFPCCQPGVRVLSGSSASSLEQSLRVEPGVQPDTRPQFRLQVAALKNEVQAQGIRDRLEQKTGRAADVVFDAGTDMYRVRWGRFGRREDAEAARGELEQHGIATSWIVSEGMPLEEPALRLIQGERVRIVKSRWIELTAPENQGIRTQDGRFRGRILVFLNPRGQLNLINELPIEDYLRGVVPKEMGPELYNEVEAIKAQAVAARTYTIRNLDEFAEEGYDICSTPRCQVYGGMPVEHPMSDRAILQTAGQVLLYAGEPAETFYSATCGGHTENVEVVFPLKRGDYLRGIPCLETGPTSVYGNGVRRGTPFPHGLIRQLLPASPGPAQRSLAARLEHLALESGLPVPRDRLRSLERREVFRFLGSVFDLAIDRRLLNVDSLTELTDHPPPDWRTADQRLADSLLEGTLLKGPDRRLLEPDEIEHLLFHLAVYLGQVVEQRSVSFLKFEEGQFQIRDGGTVRRYPWSGKTTTYAGNSPAAGPLQLMPGDTVDLFFVGDHLRAVVQTWQGRPVSLGKRAPRQRWSLFRTEAEVRQAVQKRYPGFPFHGFEILERGVSGRVGKMRLLGTQGQDLLVEGLAVRWTLDIPDTLFQAEAQTTSSGTDGWLFRGRGWGHGVGMCQAGAFGMAMRGHAYRGILEHYYRGAELGRIKQIPERPRPFTTAAR